MEGRVAEVEERDWLYALLGAKGVTRRKLVEWYKTCGSFQEVARCLPLLVRAEKKNMGQRQATEAERLDEETVRRLKMNREEAGIQIVTILDQTYPQALKQIGDPPLFFYYVGDLELLEKPLIAVVGARKPSLYGRSACRMVTEQLAKAGVVIVSGLAYGIDAEAHRSALDAGGTTIGVLGCGINVVYPKPNAVLYREIRQKGLLISEYPPDMQPHPRLFPERNRIISGLALGTVVVEAAEKSGSLVTADCALEQGREVFAIPGPIFSEVSKGPHNLIKQGAKLVTNALDILEEWNHLLPPLRVREEREDVQLSEREAFLLRKLGFQPVHWDQLREAVLPEHTRFLDMDLLRLESKGRIRSLPGAYYVKSEK